LPAKVRDAERRCPANGRAWSTFGPHAIGAERFLAVSSGRSFAQVAGPILGKRAQGLNPDKDEVTCSGQPPSGGHHLYGLSFLLLKLAVNGSVRTL
jgi:hypothetical protein